MAKSNKIEKTEKLIAGHQEAESVLSLVQKQELTANGLDNPKEKNWYVSKKIYHHSVICNTLISGKLFWQPPLRGLLNGVLKI